MLAIAGYCSTVSSSTADTVESYPTAYSWNTGEKPAGSRNDAPLAESGGGALGFFHSITDLATPKRTVSQCLSADSSVGQTALRFLHGRIPDMFLDDFFKLRFPALLIGASTLLAGCGGGGDDAAPGSTTPIAATAPGDAASDATASASGSTAASSPTTTSSDDTPVATTTDTSQDAGTVPDQVALASGTTQQGAAAAAPSRSGVGMNLTSVNSYSAEIPTIDLMKKASAWITQCQDGKGTCTGFATGARGYDTLEEASLDLDANGWVRSLPASTDATVKYRTVTTKLAEAGVQLAGIYTVVYDGQGTLTYGGPVTKVSSAPGRDVINIASSTNAVFLNITSTSSSNYLRNIRVYLPGGACASDLATYAADASACTATTGAFVPFEKFPAGTTWHPAFIASLKGFRTLRFMDWGQTNYTPAVAWTDRTPAAARTWYSTVGVPLESMFDLAAKTGANPWMNIPAHASDDYVHQFGKFAHAHLPGGQKLALEYGNEMWNYTFKPTQWVLQQAIATWPTQAAVTSNQTVLQLNWYAMRLAQVCSIVKGEFGSDAANVQCVANTQAANSWATDQVLQCTYAKAILGNACSHYIDAVAIAPYFGSYIGNASGTAAMIATWYADADGGLARLFEEINGTDAATGAAMTAPMASVGGKLQSGALAQAAGWMTATKAVTAKYGLPMWAYEGGQSLIPSTDAMLPVMAAANRDARMGASYETMMKNWRDAGGQTFMLFADASVYARGGFWGLRESQFGTSPKWNVAVKYRDNVGCWWSGC